MNEKRINCTVPADDFKKLKIILLKNDLGSFSSWLRVQIQEFLANYK